MDTVFYSGTLKRGTQPADVKEKIRGSVKKSGPTKKWSVTCETDTSITLDLGDDASESLDFSFDGNKLDGFCKVYNGGKALEDPKGQLQTVFKLLYTISKFFSHFEVSDDYELWQSYADSQRYRMKLRDLTADEEARLGRLLDLGINDPEDMLLEMVREDLGIPRGGELYTNETLKGARDGRELGPYPEGILETWLYETASYKGVRLCEMDIDKYMELGEPGFSICAYVLGITELLNGIGRHNAFGVKHAFIRRFLKEKFMPLFDSAADGRERCALAYRFSLSALDYLGFVFEGKPQ